MIRESNRSESVLEVIFEHAPRAIHFGEICSRLGARSSEKDEIDEALGELVELGLVKEMPGRRFRLHKPQRVLEVARRERRERDRLEELGVPGPPAAAETRERGDGRGERTRGDQRGRVSVTGRLTVNPRGFAFLAAEDGGPDVFIPPGAGGGALHGDRVEVFARPSARGREGDVVRVLERWLTRVTGTLERMGRGFYLEPDDPRLVGPMPVHGSLPEGAEPGVVVIAEIEVYPERADQPAEVRVSGVLGRRGETHVEVERIKIREGVIEEFPEDVIAEASAFPRDVPEDEKRAREDLRGFDLVTIDPEDARDHDDAVWAERTRGGFRILVAIADVSHYVRPGTAIDREALARGVSIYLPDRAIPMLPRELSSHLASLVPHEDRLCLAVEVDLSDSGTIRSHRYVEGVMRSGARLTYGGVARALGLTETGDRQREADDRLEMLEVLKDASALLRQKRRRRGALDFDLPEARVKLDPKTGEPVDVYRSRKDPGIRHAYGIIEDMMLLANEVVAGDMAERGVPTLYRVHGTPDEDKVAIFAELASSLGYHLEAEDAVDPKKLSKFLRRVEGTPHAQVLSYLLLRSMQQATYDTENIGHFGLAAKDYLHFTSPIRRYPDLAVHRVLRMVLQNQRFDPVKLTEQLKLQGMETSRLERRAMVVERDVVDVYRAVLVRDRIGDEFDATITGVHEWGFYSAFDEPYVDALTPAEMLDDDQYDVDDRGLRLIGHASGKQYALGDRLRVRLEDVNVSRREIIASPMAFLEHGRSPLVEPEEDVERPVRKRERAARPGTTARREPARGERPRRRGDDERRRRDEKREAKEQRRRDKRQQPSAGGERGKRDAGSPRGKGKSGGKGKKRGRR